MSDHANLITAIDLTLKLCGDQLGTALVENLQSIRSLIRDYDHTKGELKNLRVSHHDICVQLDKTKAALTEAEKVIREAHDELMGESWECPQCGRSEPTADMDVMELVLKPAMVALAAKGKP